MLYYIFGFVSCMLLYEIVKNYAIYYSFRAMELQFLFGALSLIQYKYHAIRIIEACYEEAALTDATKAEECKLVVAKIHEKFDGYGHSWIESLIARLPYKTEYNDWNSAILYGERLLTMNKNNR